MFTEAIDYIKSKGITEPKVGLILGSGLGDLADEIEESIQLDYSDIPNFPVSTVEGHDGKLVYGKLAGKKVIALKGRFHYYEGYDLDKVTFPVRIFKELGVESVIITNAAGGVNESFNPGDLMIITDHLNFTGSNPLIGQNISEHGPRFVDMTETYSQRGQQLLKDIAKDNDFPIKEGVYTWFTGPTYETPAEIKATRVMGGDAVGMSTVPEAIVAKHCGLEVFGISCITNLAAGMQAELNHEEVVEVSTKVKPRFKLLITELINQI
ncbi:purine-nucleoside phosphorylase [Ruoffia tabacinasalis]|uniref:Purine nucleoside phosphorylase n=1 Tax=Ruoffia tabacinasalis TaxID=87458 RepID=A0A5R9ELI5_9LACT|nr:purine-nucleoside phosphorylase [Ruoffia tabacinasalis]TLQ49177.1 purine-nucleoside phosphorylase [Ruoffia tabacinasalis]